jgi:hypothetical protein
MTTSIKPSGNVIIGSGLLSGAAHTYSIGPTSYAVNNTTWNGSSSNHVNITSQGALQVRGDAEFGGRVMINGQDLAQSLEKIQQRLSILVPDPKLLEKYDALRQAYEHYKTLEALCLDETNTPK